MMWNFVLAVGGFLLTTSHKRIQEKKRKRIRSNSHNQIQRCGYQSLHSAKIPVALEQTSTLFSLTQQLKYKSKELYRCQSLMDRCLMNKLTTTKHCRTLIEKYPNNEDLSINDSFLTQPEALIRKEIQSLKNQEHGIKEQILYEGLKFATFLIVWGLQTRQKV